MNLNSLRSKYPYKFYVRQNQGFEFPIEKRVTLQARYDQVRLINSDVDEVTGQWQYSTKQS